MDAILDERPLWKAATRGFGAAPVRPLDLNDEPHACQIAMLAGQSQSWPC